MRDYKLNFIVDGMKLFSFDKQDSIDNIFSVLDEIEDPAILKKVELEIETIDTGKTEKGTTEDSDGEQVKESISADDSQEFMSKLSEIITKPDSFNLDTESNTLTINFSNGDVWTIEVAGDVDDLVEYISNQLKKRVAESYEENTDGSYTVWSASDLAEDGYQIPLVTLKKDDEGKFYAEQLGDTPFDEESYQIAQNVIDTANKSGKDDKYILTRVDKTLNHNDPFFGVELDRSVVNSTTELLAAQALRTLRDDLKTFVEAGIRTGKITTDDIANKFTELTGVDYRTGEVIPGDITVKLPDATEEYIDKNTGKTKYRQTYKEHTFSGKEQYDNLLTLLGKDPKDKYNYIPPKENPFIQRLMELTGDLIDKLVDKYGDEADSALAAGDE